MRIPQSGWTALQRKEGSDFLAWIKEHQILRKKFDVLANGLRILLTESVRTAGDGCNVWKAVPAALSRCNEQSTYEMPKAPETYAWLHLLDRYVRTWLALELLVKKSCIAMGEDGVRALDIGTGPGPSGFAVHDFYTAMVEFSELYNNLKWRQPPHITCVELDSGTNSLRHRLAETMFMQSRSEDSRGVLAMCYSLPNFAEILPKQERKKRFQHFLNEENSYYNELTNDWVSDPSFSSEEANYMAQQLHRYRLFIFSNFLTDSDTVKSFEPNLVEILQDANPGSVLLILGGSGEPYPGIYRFVDELAKLAGFELKVRGGEVSTSVSEVADRVYEEGQWFYRLLKGLIPYEGDDKLTRKVCKRFEEVSEHASRSRVWAYRKYHFSKSS